MRRALLAAGAETVLAMAADDARSFGERAQALRDAGADVAILAVADRGDADRCARLTEALRAGCAAQRPPLRVLVASGDDGAIARATRLATPFEVEVAPDPRGEDGRRRLAARVRDLRREDGILRDDALDALGARLGEARGAAVLVIDSTDRSTSLVRAQPRTEPLAVHARRLGLDAADRIVAGAGLDRMRRWIPWSIDAPTLLDRAFNRARWPGAVATDRETRALEAALSHEALALALALADAAGVGAGVRSTGLVVLTGRSAALEDDVAAAVLATLAIGPRPVLARDRGDTLVAAAGRSVASGDRSELDAAIQGTIGAAAVAPR